MSADEQQGTHGYLALVQLLASAAADRRLTNSQRQALNVLARFAGPDGTCCVSLARVAELLGIKRQVAQRALQAAEQRGYLTSERRYRRTGAEGAKVFAFNLALEGALACPVPRPQWVHPLEGAGGCTLWKVQGVHPLEGAHKKPVTKKPDSEDTNACSPSARAGKRRRGGKAAGRQEGLQRLGQRPLLLPIVGARGTSPPGKQLRQRVQTHNRAQASEASGRLWSDWCRLDPELALFDRIGEGRDRVTRKAQDLEGAQRGQGLRYVAGAVERATAGRITAAAILAGRYARQAAAP